MADRDGETRSGPAVQAVREMLERVKRTADKAAPRSRAARATALQGAIDSVARSRCMWIHMTSVATATALVEAIMPATRAAGLPAVAAPNPAAWIVVDGA